MECLCSREVDFQVQVEILLARMECLLAKVEGFQVQVELLVDRMHSLSVRVGGFLVRVEFLVVLMGCHQGLAECLWVPTDLLLLMEYLVIQDPMCWVPV